MKIIKICDSVRYLTSKNKLPTKCIVDVKKFLNYYYPEYKDQWIQETALNEDRFQDANTEGDCGYHLINFMEGACKNEQIHAIGNEFIILKTH